MNEKNDSLILKPICIKLVCCFVTLLDKIPSFFLQLKVIGKVLTTEASFRKFWSQSVTFVFFLQIELEFIFFFCSLWLEAQQRWLKCEGIAFLWWLMFFSDHATTKIGGTMHETWSHSYFVWSYRFFIC